MPDPNSNTSRWILTGHYPHLDFSKEYSRENDYTETNINTISIKTINTTLDYHAVCSYADMITSGNLCAVWDGTDIPDEHARLQRHDCFEFYYIVKGPVRSVVEYTPVILNSGDCILLNRHVRNMYHYTPDTLAISVSITEPFFQEQFLNNHRTSLSPKEIFDFILPNMNRDLYNNREYMLFTWKGGDVLYSDAYRYLMDCYEELRRKQPCYTDMLKGYLSRAFHAFTNGAEYDIRKECISQPTGKELTGEIKSFLDHNPRKISRQDLGAHFHFNGDYLCEVFRKNMNQTVHNYNQQVYMKEALALLQKTDLSVSRIAGQLGFASRAQFYKAFEKYYQHPVSFYRNDSICTSQ